MSPSLLAAGRTRAGQGDEPRPKLKEASLANKYMYLYVGGGAPPASEAEGKAMMAQWMEYFGKLGSAVVEGGAPFAPESKFLGKGAAGHPRGYSIVTADSLDKAVALTAGHPHLANDGGIEVLELAKVPGV